VRLEFGREETSVEEVESVCEEIEDPIAPLVAVAEELGLGWHV
jgi:hypothetical protein